MAWSRAVSRFLVTDGLKHYFSTDVKHCLTYRPDGDNQEMLDSLKLAKKIRDAMDLKNPPVAGSALAKECGVTPQAVYGWRTNGRVAKKHLQTIARLTGKAVEYFLSDDFAEQPSKKGQTEKIKDRDNFRMLVRAWQTATPDNRDTMLKLATTILKLDGTRNRKRAS